MVPADDLKHIFNSTESVWGEFRDKRVLISGGTGFVGTWLVESFLFANQQLALGAEIFVLSRNPEAFFAKAPDLKNNKSLHFIKGDVRTFVFPEGPFHFVIHAAMDPSNAVNKNGSFETLDVSYSGTKRILDFCMEKKVLKYLYVSSGAVYGPQPENMAHISETYNGAPDVTLAASAYGEGKRVGEWLSHHWGKTYGFEAKIARCFALVGPGLPLNGHFAVGNFIRDALDSKDIIIKGTGASLRSYLYASDMTVWLWQILIHGRKLTAYNVGSESPLSILGLAEKITSLVNPKLKIVVQGKESQGLSADQYIPSAQKAKNELKLEVRIGLDEALKKTIDFYNAKTEPV
jgi:nucleoside-diphosphate-sugar epimerase